LGQGIDLAGEFRNFPGGCVPVENALGTSPLNKGDDRFQGFPGALGVFLLNGQSHLFNLVSHRRYDMGVSGSSLFVLFGPFNGRGMRRQCLASYLHFIDFFNILV